MKLYASVTSERATKGQGGNERLFIDLSNENKDIILSINCWIDGDYAEIAIKNWLDEKTGNVQQVQRFKNIRVSTKGNKQKGDIVTLPNGEKVRVM